MEVFDAVSQGTAEMGHGAAYYWRKDTCCTDVCYRAIWHDGAGDEWMAALWQRIRTLERLYKPFDIVPFTTGNSGVQMGGWFNKEILSVDDLQRLKMRIPGLGGEVLARAGRPATAFSRSLYCPSNWRNRRDGVGRSL